MLAAIEFDGRLLFMTIEIKDEMPDIVLPVKLMTI